jgi:LPS export ABC transporter protein LptC
MQKFYSSKAFQFFAIIIIASLCLLLNTLTQINFHKMALPKTHPQYNARGITGGVYSRSGKLLYNVQSKEAWEFPDDDRIFLKGLEINLFNESSDVINYSIKSDNGWINRITKVGQLGESTILQMSNPDPKQVITMYGKNINVNMDSNIFSSNEDAHAVQGRGTVYTHGFKYDNNKHFLVLNSKVRVIYEQ